MESTRSADERDIENSPLLARYSRMGPVFSVRTDGPAFEGPSFSSLDTGIDDSRVEDRPGNQKDLDSDIIFTPEAAEILKSTTQQTSELARKGLIPAFKVGKRWRFSRKNLLEWVEKTSTRHLDLFSPSATAPASPEPVKIKPRKRRNFPTDLSPEGLREALKNGIGSRNKPASKTGRAK